MMCMMCLAASGGIFSMHEAAGTVLTASKDCTVAVSLLGQGVDSCFAYQQRLAAWWGVGGFSKAGAYCIKVACTADI